MNCAPWKQNLRSRWNFITTSPSNMAVVMKNDQLKWRQKHAVFPRRLLNASTFTVVLLCSSNSVKNCEHSVANATENSPPQSATAWLLLCPKYSIPTFRLHFWGRSTAFFVCYFRAGGRNLGKSTHLINGVHPHTKSRNPIVLPSSSATEWLYPERTSSLTESSFCLSRYQACQRIHYCHWGGEAGRSGARPVLQFKDNRSAFTRYGQGFPRLRSIVCTFSQWELVV